MFIRRIYILVLFCFLSIYVLAGSDSICVKTKKHVGIYNTVYNIVKAFNDVDTNYIEPQKYNYTVMMQNTFTYEMYKLQGKSGQYFRFAPKPAIKLGPYLGWRWIFLGYQVDMGRVGSTGMKNTKTEFNLSLYSSLIGVDIFFRNTGSSYRIQNSYLGRGIDTSALDGVSFSGINVGIKGFNLYYIFNHYKFSYPAAFSQSTRQKKSCGSALLGIGYTQHSLSLDYLSLQNIVKDYTKQPEIKLDSGLMFEKVKYTDLSVSGGYAYNLVLSKNLLLAASLSLALGYKNSIGNVEQSDARSSKIFNFRNFNLDGVGRFGFIWNNSKYYFGGSCILHSYNYNKERFSTNNVFGSMNIYIGYNFGKR